MSGVRRRGRPRTAWMDNIKTWTGLSVEESIRMTEINGESTCTSMVWPTVGSRTAEERNVDHGHRSVGTESEGDVTGLRGTVPRSTDGSLLFYMLLWIVCACWFVCVLRRVSVAVCCSTCCCGSCVCVCVCAQATSQPSVLRRHPRGLAGHSLQHSAAQLRGSACLAVRQRHPGVPERTATGKGQQCDDRRQS